jgi:hypothetical protein
LWTALDALGTKIPVPAVNPSPVARPHAFRMFCKILLVCGACSSELRELLDRLGTAHSHVFADTYNFYKKKKSVLILKNLIQSM